MKQTKAIGFLIVILTIILIIVLIYIAKLTVLNTNVGDSLMNNINNTTNIEKVENKSTKNTSTSVNNSVGNTNNTDDVFYSEEETGNVQYNRNHLNNFSIKINGINEEIEKYIKNMDEFNLQIKEYMYKKGLVDATEIDVQKYEHQESTGRLGIIFKLNNPDEDRLRVIINSNGNIDISNYD